MSGKKSRKVRMGSSRQPRQNQEEHETNKDDDGSQMLSKERKVVEVGADSVSVILQTDLVSSDNLSTITQQHTEINNPPLNDVTESHLSQPVNPYLLKSLDTAGKRRKMGSTRQNKRKPEETDFGEKQDTKTGDAEKSLQLQASIAVVESWSYSNTEELLGPKESETDTECLLFASNTLDQPDDRCKEEVGEDIEPSSEAVASYSSELLQDTLGTKSILHLPLDLALQVVHGFPAEPITEELKKEEERRQESEHAEVESSTFLSSRHSLDQSLESDTLTNTEEFESFNNTIILQSGEGEEKLEPVVNESELQDDINSTGPGNQETLHQRDEDENFVDLIVEENNVLANITHFRQPDHVESYEPEQSEDITCFLQSTPSDSSLGHDKSAQSESRRRKMGSTRRNPRGRHEEEEHGESKMRRYRYLYDEGEEVILGKEEKLGIEETEFEISMEPKDSASVDEKEGEQMEKENFQTEEDTENIEETGRRLEWDMGTVEGSGVETSEESLMLLEREHGADEEKKGMEEESLIEPTPFDQYIDSFGIADQLYNQEKGNIFTVDSVNTETESNNEASMAHIVDPRAPFSVGLDQSGDTLLREEDVSDFTLLVNNSEVSKSSQIAYDCALTLESDDTFSTDPKISPSQLIQTPCMEITNPFLNPLLPQSIQGNEEDANTDPNTTGGLDTSEVILLSEEEMSDHVPLVNEVSVSSQMTCDDRTLTTEPCQTDEALSTDPNISASQLNQTPYSDESHNSFPNSLLLQSVQDQGDNAANTDSNQSPSPSRRRKMGSTRRHPRGVQREEEGTEEKQEGEIESTEEIEDKRENMDAVEGSCMEFEMLMESKDGAGNEKNEGEERNEETVLTDLSWSFSTSNQEGRNIEADNIESESQSIIKDSMDTKVLLLREAELTQISQILHNPYPDVPTIESYDSYLTDDTLNSNPAITGLQHKGTLLEETLDESRGNTDSPPDPPSLQSSLGPEETAEVESYTPGRKRKIGSTRSKTHRGRKGEERREEGQEDEKGEDTDVIGEVGDVIITAEMDSSIEKTELVELEELLEKVTEDQAMGDPAIIVVEGEVNIVVEGESGIEKSELVEHTEKVGEAEEIEVEVKIVAESESNQTPSDTAALTVEAQESGDMVCIEPYITSQYMEDNNPSLNDLTELNLSQTENPYLLESPDTAKKRRKRGSTRRNKGKQAETDFGEKQDAKTGDAEKSLQLQASIAVVESWSYSNTEELLGPKESETDTECLLFASNTLDQPDDRCKEEVGEDIEPSSEAVASYSSELLQDTLGTKSLLHLPLDLALQVVHGIPAEPITEELKKEEERRQESEHAEVESSTFLSSRHSLDQSLESDTLTNTEEFESFNNTIILQSGEGEEKLEPVVNESELQDDINSTGPGNQETLHQRDEDENFVDLIVEENIVLANITHFRQPDHVESYEPEQSEDITCFLQSTPSDSSLGHDKSAQSESRRRKMGSTRRNPRGKHEEEEHGESKMRRYRYLYDDGEEVILGKEEKLGIEETEFEISMEPKDSASVDEKEGEQMEKENFQTEEDTENIEETGRRLEWDMGTVEGSGVETSEESLMLLEREHGADEEKKGMEEESLIEPTPFDQYIDSFGIADQLYNQEKGNIFTVDSVNTETESNNEASMAHIVDPRAPFSVGLDQSGDTLLREEEVSDFTLLVNNSEVSKSSQIAYDCALTLESDDTFSTDPKISPSQLIQTPCMEITNPFLNPLLPQSIQGNEEDANTDPNTTGGLDTSEVILLSEEEMSDHVPLVNEVSVSSQMTCDDRTLTTEPCQTDEALSTDPNISASQLNQTPYSDESHNSFPNSLLLQSVQDQGDNAANTDSNQSPSPSRRRKMGSTRRHPRGVQREEEGTEEKQEGEIESTEEIEDKRENMDAVEGSCMEFEMLMESKDGAGNEKNEGEERNEETVLTDLSWSFSTSNQEGRNIEADNIESESQSIIKDSMDTKVLLLREAELTQISQTLHNPYPDVPTIESYDSYLTDDTLNSNPAITGLQHKGTSLEETLDESRGNTDSPPDPPSLQSSLGPEETAEVESYTPGRKRKIGSTRSKTHRGRKGEERREEGQEDEKGEDTYVIGEVGDVIITAEMDSSIEKTELVELEELLEKVTEEQAMGDPAIIVVEGEVNIVVEGESGIEKSELVEHTEKVGEAEEIEVEVKIVAESESNQTPSDTAALTVEAQESGDMVCIEPYITSQYMEDNNPSLNDLTELNLSQTENPYLLESPDTAKKRRKRGSTRRNKGKQAETDFGEKQDAKTGDAEKSLQLQASIAVVESWSYSNTEELLGPKESETDTECLLFASNTLDQPDDRCKEEVGEDIEPSSEAVASYSSELLQDTLGTKSLLHLPLDLALQVVHGFPAEPITEELKKEEERRQESEHAEVESSTFLSSRHSLDQSLESDTLTNTEEFESFNNTIILQSGEGEEKLEPVVNESELQDYINSTGPGNQETLHQRDEDENFVDLIVEENIVLANITHFRQPDHVESYEPEQSEDITCFLQSTPSDSSLGHDKSAQSESRRRKMGSTRRNPRGRHEEEEHGESKMRRYRYLYDEGEEVILGKEEKLGIEETEFEISMEPKDSASVDEKEGEQMEKENFQTEEDTENIEETGRRLEWDMGTVEGSGVETSEESLMLLEREHGADEEKKGMEEESLIEPTPFDQYIDSFGIADQLYNQEKGNIFTVDSVNTETESNNEASMAHIVDPRAPFSVGLDQSGDTLLREEESIQGNEEDANTDPNTTGGLDTSEVILLSEEEMSDHVPLVNKVSVSSQMTCDDRTLTTEPCQTDEALSTDPNISASQLNQTPYSDESHNSFPNSLLLQSVQDQGDNAANTDSNQSPSPSRRRKMGSTRRHPRGVQREEEGTEEKQEGEIESTEEIEDKRENMDAVEGSCMEFEMLMESKDGAGNEKNEGEERNEETVLTDLSWSFSTSNQEGRNIEADNIESESQSIIKDSMDTKVLLLREAELTQISQILHNPYPDVPTIESYDSYLTDDTLNSNPAITGLQHKGTLLEETLDESRGNTDSPPDPPSLQSSLGPEETAEVESYTPGRKRKIGSTRSKTHRGRKGEERREEGQEDEKGEDTDVIGEVGDVIITAEMDSSIEKTELVELEELLEKVTEDQAMGDPAIIVVEGEVNIVVEGESGIEKSELVEHTEKVGEAEEIEVEVKIVAESESNQTPSDTAALTVEAQESGDMVCIEPYITSQYMEDNNPSLNDLTELNLSQTENPYLLESPDTAKKRRKRGSTRRNKGKQAETDFGEKQDAKTGDAEKSLQLQASIAVVESWSYSNTEELLGPKESETDTECLLFASNTLDQPDDRCKEEVGEDIEPSSEAVASYSSELLQDTLGTKSLLHLPLDLALQVVHGFPAEPITEELKKEEERRQESEHAEVESSTFLSSRHSLDQSLESDTLTNTEEFESFNNTIILQSGEGEEKLEPVVNESELQDDINSTGPGNQETLHQRDEDENFVDLIVEENIVLANITHFRQPDHVESYEPEQSEDITCFLQSTPSDSSLGHDKSAQSESRRRKMGSTRRNPRGRHEEEEHGESKMRRYRYLYDEGEEVILGKEEKLGIEETEFEISMEPKDSASVDEKEGEQMEKENFQTEEDTENIEETGRRLEWDMGTVEGSGVETSEESLMLLEREHGADEEKKGMEEESLIEPTPFDQYIDSFGIADQLYNQEKGNIFTVDSVNTETESNNEASMAHIVDPRAPFSVGLDQSGDTLLREEEVSDFTLLVNNSEVSKSSQIAYDCALTLESDDTFSTDPKISPSQLIQTPCMEITNPFLNPLLPQSIQGNEEDANTDPNTTGGLDTSEVILLSEEEMSDHVPLVNEVSVSSQMTCDDRTLTTEPCQTDEALSTDPNISASQLNQTPYSDESHNSFPNSLLLQSVQDQGDNAANTDSNQSPSPSRRRKMGSTRRHPRGVQREEEGTEEKQEGEIESTEEIEDKRENMDAVEGSCMEFEMLMESKDGAGNEKNEGEERNEETVLTDLSWSFSTSNQEGRNIEADNIESESQSIIKDSMDTKVLLLREAELTQISQILHNPYPDVPTIESYDSYLTDDTLNSNPAITGLQHKGTLLEETLDESRGNTDSPPDPPSLQSSLGPEETAEVESYTPGRKRKIGSTRSKTHRGRKGEERREEGQEDEKGEDTDVIGEVGDVIITAEMDSSIEKTELVELEELLEKVTEDQAMGDPAIIVVEGEVNIVVEGESGIEKSELVEHTEKVGEAEEIEVEVKIVAESESNQTPSDTAALTVEAQESGDMVCIEPYITSQYMEDNNPSLNDLTELNLSQTENPYLLESPDTAKKRRKRGSTRRNKGKQAETDFGEKQDAKTGDAEKSLQLQASIAVVESWSYSNTEELLGPKESETDTECLLFASNTLDQPDDRCKEEVGEDIEPSSEAVASYSSELLQDTLGTKSLLHLPLDLALQVVHGIPAEPITEELKKEEERRQESEHAEVESSTFLSSRHSLDQSLESDTLTNTEEFESFNNTIILQSGEGEEKLEPVVNESELQDDINSTGPGNQETLHQRDEDENFVDLIVEENIVLANITHFRQPDHVESYEPEQSEDITCFLQSTPSDSSLGHDKSAQSESRRRKMGSTRRNPRGRHEEEEHGESKMRRYRYLYDEGEEVILGKEEKLGIEETEFEISMEPKDSASVDEKEGEQMEKENFQTEEDTENIEETGRRLEWDMGTVEGSGVETSEESLMLLEREHGADEEKKGMEEESLIEPTPFDQYIDSFGIADQLYNQEKGNIFTVDSVNTETESNNEASMAHIVDPRAPFSVGLDQSGDTLLREEEVSDFTLLVNNSEVSKSSQIAYDCALTLESDDTFSTDPKISPSQLIQTPCMEITNPFLNPLLPQSIQGNEEDANTDPNTTGGLDTSEVILLSEEEMSDHVPLVNEVSVSSQMTCDDRTLTTEPCQTDEALSTDPNISASQLNQTPYSDESHNSFPNSLLLQSVQDQGDNAANTDSNQSPSPSRRRKMGSTRRHPRGVQREEEGTEEKQEGEIESTEEIEDKRENMDAVEGSCMEFEMLMESKDGAGNEKNEGEERNEETVLTDLSWSFSTSNQEGRNIEADNIESESQSIIKDSMDTKVLLLREAELTQISQILHNPYPDVPTIESYDSYLTDDTLNSNPAITGLQHKGTLLEETLDESRGNTDSPPDPPSLQSSLGPEETAEVESYTPGRKRKIGSTRSKTHRGRKGEERREEGQEDEKGEDTDVIGEVGDVIITAEMDSSIEKTELVELEELLEKVTEDQAMGDPAIIVVEGEVNIVVEGESGIEKSELVEHTEKVGEAEEIEVEVKIVAESESNQTPSDTAALTVEAQESGDMVCIEPYITSQYMEDNNPSLNDLTELNLSQTENPYLLESPDTAKKRRKRGSTRRNKGKQAETDFGEKQDAKTGDAEKSLQLQASIAVVESWSYSNTEELLGPKESETDTECLLFASNTLDQPDDRCKEEVGEDIEPSSEAVASYSSELLQDTLGTKSLLHLPLDLALQVVHGIPAEPITEELKKEEERRQESEHAEVESSTFLSSRHSLDQSLESDTLTNTEEFESFNNTIILQSGEGEEKLEPVVNESELQDDINSTGPGNQETLHQRDEDENFVDLIVEENIVLANITHFRQPDHVESYEPEQSEDITCFLQSTPSDSSLGHDKSAQSESRRRKMGSTRRNPRGRHEEEEHGESKMRRYRYLYDDGEEVILGKEEKLGIEETEFEISMEPKDSASVDEKEGEQMEKENFQTEEDTENIEETGRRLEWDMGTVEGSGVETSEESLMLLEREHGADEEKKGMEEESLIEPTPFDQYIDSFGIADQLYNQEKGNIFTVDSVNTETESNNEASMAHIVDPRAPFSVGLDQSGDTLLREEEVSDFTLLVNNSEVSKSSQIAYDCALTLESDDTFSTDPKISPSQLIQTPCMEITNPFLNPLLPQSIQGNEEDANTDPNTTGGLDTSEVILLSEEEMSDHVPLVNKVSVSSQMTCDDRTLTTEPCQTDEALSTDPNISASQLNQTPYSDESHNSFPNSLLLQSVQDQGDNAANTDSNQSPSPSRRRKMGSTRRHPRGVQREEEGTEEKQEGEIESTEEIEDKRENMDAVEGSCMEFEMLMESKDGAGNEKNEGEERNEETVLTDLSWSFSTSNQEGRNIEADNIESESQSIIKESMDTKLLLLCESDFAEIRETLHNPDVPTLESHLTDDTLISTDKVREVEEIEVEVKIVMESQSIQTPSDAAALTVEAQESGDMVCIDPHISAIQLTQAADMEQCLLTQSNSPSLPSKSSLSLSSQSREVVGESKATGNRRKMGFTHRTQGGLHAEEEKQETGENITEAEVRAETIGNPEVNAVLERFQEERRAEAVSLEDQQEIQSTEKETILIEVVASSTVLSGKGSEPVAPALQPGPGNKRGQEKAERVEKPLGTFGSSGSSSNPYNVVMVGNSSVGKTSFMRRFQSGEFCLHHDATIGIDTCIQSVTVDASPVTLQLWDTAGQERFHSITRQVFHKAQGLMLMYDITSSQSFCDICYWVNCIQEGAPDDVIVILLGNKNDCADLEREVQTHEGENLAKGYDMLFMECSAATGDNVTLSMETLARMLKQLGEQTRQEEGSLVLQKEPPKKKSGCC
ncbi:uncharacterized protein [Salvelinus alpinus]|uniref:uncharacterized protein isoform X3 n=1 Tax=Salvelinus alpinus TaxID=8036 RepID=UPI0039FBE239